MYASVSGLPFLKNGLELFPDIFCMSLFKDKDFDALINSFLLFSEILTVFFFQSIVIIFHIKKLKIFFNHCPVKVFTMQ